MLGLFFWVEVPELNAWLGGGRDRERDNKTSWLPSQVQIDQRLSMSFPKLHYLRPAHVFHHDPIHKHILSQPTQNIFDFLHAFCPRSSRMYGSYVLRIGDWGNLLLFVRGVIPVEFSACEVRDGFFY